MINNCLLSLGAANIRALSGNHASVENHLAKHHPHILFLSETQVSDHSPSPNISSYFLQPKFRFKGGVCSHIYIVALQLPDSKSSSERSMMPYGKILFSKIQM
jgi:hypothetical protein